MNRFLRVSLIMLLTGLAGSALFAVIDFVRPKTGLQEELEQTKKMLRLGFDKNRALVAENAALNEKLMRLLGKVSENDEEIASLRKQLENQVGLVRKFTKERAAQEASLASRRALPEPRPSPPRLEAQLEEARGQTAKAEEELKNVIESAGLAKNRWDQERQALAKDLKRLRQENSLLRKMRSADAAQIQKLKQQAPSPPPPRAVKGSMDKLMGSMEDLIKEMDEKKGTPSPKPTPGVGTGPHPWGGGELKGEGEKDKQIEKLRRELERERKDHRRQRLTFYYNLGVVYTHYGLLREAVQAYEKALMMDPSDASTHYNLAILYDDHWDRKDKAVLHYRRYLALNPKSAKRREVENWIKLAGRVSDMERYSRAESARDAFEHTLMKSTS